MITGGSASRSSRKLSVQVSATRTPTHVSVRSSSKLSRSQSTFASGTPGSARRAATATTPAFTTANRTPHAIAVSTTGGRVSQAFEPSSVTATTALGKL